MFRFLRFLVAVATLLALPSLSRAADEQITVFAAASLTNALQEIDAAYTKATAVPVKESFASSSTLARQIEAGAPAQLFISADTKWMDYLANKGLVAAQTPLLGNELAVIAPADSPLGPHPLDRTMDWLRLLGPQGRLAVGDPDHVPAGIYAKEALQHLGAWETLAPRLARADDVRGALAFVERGETPLGIVYVTDARASTGVKIVGVFPAATHSPIIYPAAILKGADSPSVERYYHCLQGSEAHAIFARWGFKQP